METRQQVIGSQIEDMPVPPLPPQIPGTPQVSDMGLEMDGVPEATANLIKAAKVIVAAMLEPGGPIRVATIAEKTKYSEWQVEYLLSHPAYTRLVEDTIRVQMMGLIGQSLEAARKIIQHGKDELKLAAGRFCMQAYKTFADQGKKLREAHSADKEHEQLMDGLDTLERPSPTFEVETCEPSPTT